MDTEKIKNILMFREASDDDNSSTQPIVTTGSIVWGILIRASIIIFLSIVIFQYYELYKYWWYVLFLMWFLVAWPAYRQFQAFNKRIDKFEEETLCGTCRHFEKSGQFCRIYDEHVSSDYIPCDGSSWEPK